MARKLKACKKLAAKEFQKMIRLEAADEYGMVRCVTCDVKHWWENQEGYMHAGHFVGGRTNSILFVESNCHSQCARCNKWMNGNIPSYTLFMYRTYGQEEIDRLYALKQKVVKFSKDEILEMRHAFRARIKKAEARLKGIVRGYGV